MHQQNSPSIYIVMAWTFEIYYSFRTSNYCWRLVPALFFWIFFPTSSETKAYPACAFGAPHSFNHLLVIAAIPRFESSAPVHVTNRTSLGPEFCEPSDRHLHLHYVVWYIDPENLLSVVSHPFCSYRQWCAAALRALRSATFRRCFELTACRALKLKKWSLVPRLFQSA